MASLFIFKAGALALACASTATASYVILDDFSGPNFFDNFYFNATLDPTHGFVEYLGADSPTLNSLAYYDATTDTAVMRVDDSNTYTPGVDIGRPSIRAQTKNSYQYGLFILDLAHMPGGACGSWPAFWTTSINHWPEQGEIDIIENVNFASFSEQTLHAGPVFPGDVCEVVGNVNTNPGQQTGTQTTYNCMWNATISDYGSQKQYSGQGCSANNNNLNNFGDSFNAVQGGVYAMEWTDEIIQIWSWENGVAPTDIANGTPDPLSWGKPIFTTWGGNCDIARHFIDQTVVFDTTFCGDWGNAVWTTSSCYDSVLYPTCSDYVGANPSAFTETYWAVRSLKVYQWSDAVASPSSSSTVASSTSSTTSTSSAAATTSLATTTTTAPTTPTAPTSPLATIGNWEEVGCFTEATASRALTLGTKVNYSTMDLEECSAYCYTLGALYFGVEYGGECYCGDELETGSIPATDDGCDMPCGGNVDETCGGKDRLNVFIYVPSVASTTASSSISSTSYFSSSSSAAPSTSTPDPSTSSAAPSSSSSAAPSTSSADPSTSSAASSTSIAAATTPSLPSIPTSPPQNVAAVGSCERIGCYTEGYEIRALSDYQFVNYTNMSPEICSSLCPGYSYFGVEYGGECYCGNTINNGSTIAPDTDCNMPCGGFPEEFCGAGNRLDMFYCGSQTSSSSSSALPSSTSSLDPASSSSTSSSPASSSSSTSSDPTSTSSSASSDPAPTSSSTSSSSTDPPSPTSSSSIDPPPSPTSSSSIDPPPSPTSSSSIDPPPSPTSSSSIDPPPSSTSSEPTPISSSTGSSSIDPPPSPTTSYPATSTSSTSSSYSVSNSTTSYPVIDSSSSVYLYRNTSSSTPLNYIASASPSSHSLSYTTETITTTTCRTISSCAPTITNCPYGSVTTDTIVLTTTYCPGNPTPTSSAAVTSAPAQTTLTVYTTTVYTITSCAPTVTNCPAKLGAVTTEAIVDYTTVCPIEEAISKGLITAPTGASTSTAYTSLTVVKLITQTVQPVAYTPSPYAYAPSANGTLVAAGSTALTYSSSPSPSSSPISYKGGASGVQAGKGSGLAMVVVVVAAALFL